MPLAAAPKSSYFDQMQDLKINQLLEKHGLRATRQRLCVAELLYGDGVDKHVSAEWVADQLTRVGEAIALATVYNTLHSFVQANMMRVVGKAVGGVTLFDTNTSPHHHFYNESTGALIDIPAGELSALELPELPTGTELVDWEMIIRVR